MWGRVMVQDYLIDPLNSSKAVLLTSRGNMGGVVLQEMRGEMHRKVIYGDTAFTAKMCKE
jgi:hypothetical protein